jgi:hypothetical protein
MAVIAYTQGTESSIGSTIATQATIASHPIERMIHVQTAACAAVRMLISGGVAEPHGQVDRIT